MAKKAVKRAGNKVDGWGRKGDKSFSHPKPSKLRLGPKNEGGIAPPKAIPLRQK
jgi:hypothetical protein